MTIHKSTRLLPKDRQEIFEKYHQQQYSVSQLADEYRVSRVTIYRILREVRIGLTQPKPSINKRFRTLEYGLKRLAKIEHAIQEKLKAEAKRYNKSYPGELVHVDCVRLPLLTGESKKTHRYEYLIVGIDDFSRELYARIIPDKTATSTWLFLEQLVDECPYLIECIYSDNGKEFKGTVAHPFMSGCSLYQIDQKFTRVKRPQTNGKAERVIRTLLEMWHQKERFMSRDHRKMSLNRFINYYNTVKPHAGLKGMTPLEKLIEYFFKELSVNNA